MRRTVVLVALAAGTWGLAAQAAEYMGAMDNRYGFTPLPGFTAQSNAWSGSGGAGKGLRLEWTVDDTSNPGFWTYKYTLVRGTGVNKAFALFDIETASDFTKDDIHSWMPVAATDRNGYSAPPGGATYASEISLVEPAAFTVSHDFSNAASTEAYSTTALNDTDSCQYSGDPERVPIGTVTANGTSTGPIAHPFYGIRWIFPGTGFNSYVVTAWSVEIVTARAPMWGSFFGWGDQTSQSPYWYANFYSDNIPTTQPNGQIVAPPRLTLAPASTVDPNGNALSNFSTYQGWILVPGPADAPAVLTTFPADGATGVALNDSLAATFSRAMDSSSVTAAFTFSDMTTGAAVTGTVSYDPASDTAIFTPDALVAGHQYTVTVAATAKDSNGMAMRAPATWTFTAGAESDSAPPTISWPSSATGFPIAGPVVATFSEPIDPRSLAPTSLTLQGASGPVSGTATYDPAAHTLSFVPGTMLSPTTSYTATVAAGLRDLAGNAAPASSWSFTTEDVTPPAVLSRSPDADAVNVPIDSAVTVVLGDEVDPTSVSLSTFYVTGVPGAVTYDPASGTATFTPRALLSPDKTQYTVAISGVKDLAGNKLELIWHFTTALAGDVNYDGKVDDEDVKRALDFAVGNVTPTAAESVAGDLGSIENGKPDGHIDVSDVVLILKKATSSP